MMKHTKIGFWLLLLLAPLTLAAQAPIITHMQTTAASAGEQITIYGANFQAVAGNNTVSFDGVAGTVNSATTKVLKVTVPSATAGPANVRVTTVGGSSPNITNFSIISVNMGGAFEAATFFDIGNPAREIAVGDLSGDGIVDIITTDANSTSFILTGDGDGTFTDGPNLGTNSTSTGITLADFNKDGLLDIAVTNSAISGTVSIRLNTGSNTFASPVTYAIGSFPVFVRSGDFNSDGNIDLVTSNYLGDNISLILGSGSGTFGSNTDFAVGDGPGYLAVGDFDNDNNLDVAVTNSNDDNVSILIGNGSGSFASAVNYSIGNNPQGIGVGYFNADTNLDLAVANDFDDNVGILLGAGDGTFATATHFTVSDSPKGLTVVDVNGDGLADVATSNGSAAGSTDRASVLISNGDGTFKTFKPYAAGPDPGSIASADFNNDGMMDIVVSGNHATNNISIILNDQPIVNTTTSITSIDPPFGIPGQHVTIHGSAFDNTPTNNTVTFDGVTANVIIASEFEMTVEVPLATLGTNSVVVSNSSGTSGLTNNFTVIIPNKPSSFPSFNNYTTSDSPRGAAAGDFDNDGDIDLAVPSSTGNHVQILTGNGNGTFSAGGTFAVNSSPYAVVTGDFNDDGNLDLATAHFGFSFVSILLGNGNGTFQSFTSVSAGSAVSLVAADFDRNGFIDLATANIFGDNVTVLLSQGDGTFTSAGNFTVGDQPEGIIEGDFNGDGYPDVATSNLFGNNVSVLINNGDGTFASVVNYGIGGQGKEIIAADFDNDGDVDLAAARGSSISVLLGTGSGTFSAAINYNAGAVAEGLALGDFDGDGNIDIATENVAVLPGNGDGTFGAPTSLMVESSAASVTFSDFNNDGLLDLVTANWNTDNISVVLAQPPPTLIEVLPTSAKAGATIILRGHQFGGVPVSNTVTIGGVNATVTGGNSTTLKVVVPTGVTGSSPIVVSNANGTSTDPLIINVVNADDGGGFKPVVYYTGSSIPFSLTLADFNNNGTTDVATANDFIGTGSVDVALGNGDGTLTIFTDFPSGDATRGIIHADLNSDLKIDLVTSNDDSDDISVMLGNGDGTFASPINYSTGAGPSYLAKADFNNDGLIDIITANRKGSTVSILLGLGSGGFTSATNVTVGSGPQGVIAADFDNDGNTDIAVNRQGLDQIGILLGNGDGSFGALNSYSTGDQPQDLVIGDFNNDGLLDIVNVYLPLDQLTVLMNIGSGAFASPVFFATGDGPSSAIVGDFNGDANQDIATGNVSDLSVLFGNGDGTFQAFKTFGSAGTVSDLNVADLDNDGLADLVLTGSSNMANIRVLLGANTDADILTFSFAEQTGAATINGVSATVNIEVAAGTNTGSLTPTISLSPDASILPNSGVARNFTNPVNYSVTADDQTTSRLWSVTVVAVPVGPTLLLNNTEQTTAEINWNVPSYTESFELQLSTQSNFSTFVTGYNPKALSKTTMSESFSGLAPGTTYYARVRSLNINSSPSVYSNVVEFTTKPNTPILNTIAGSNIGQTSVTASWTAVAGLVGDYQLEVSSTDFSITTTLLSGYPITVTGTSVDIGTVAGTDPLSPGTDYWIRMRARNTTGESPNSNVLQILTKPATPTLNDVMNVTQSSAVISWAAVAGTVDNYLIDLSSTDFALATTLLPGYPLSVSNSTSEITFGVDPGAAALTSGTDYWVRLRSENTSGESVNSNVVQILTIPGNPTSTSAASITTTSFQAIWTAVTGASYYLIDISADDFATFILQDQNVTGALSFDVSGLQPSTLYKYRVRAGNLAGLSDYSNVIGVTTTGGSASPLSIGSVTYNSKFSDPPGTSVINVSVVGGTGSYSAALRHKGILEDNYQSFDMTSVSSGSFTATLEAAMLDELGVEFEIVVNDGISTVTDQDNKIFKSFDNNQSEPIPFASFGGQLENWNLFSIPYQLDDNLIQSVFDEMGSKPYLTQWRLMQYKSNGDEDGDYVDFGSGINRIETGQGYWFNAIEAVSVKIGSGSVTSALPFSLNLQQGWNQIGNTYNVPISWNQVLADNGNPADVGSIQVFTGITQSTGDVVDPFKGGFVWADNNSTIIIDPRTARSSGRSMVGPYQIEEEHIDEVAWKIPMFLSYNHTKEFIGGFGMHPKASSDKDPFDSPALPRFIFYSDFYSIHSGSATSFLSSDIVKTSTKHVWEFNLVSNKTTGPAFLEWNPSSFAGSYSNLFLVDQSTGVVVDMKHQGTYQVLPSHASKFEIHFFAAGENFEPTSLLMGDVYPNPATMEVTIPILLPTAIGEAGIKLTIHDQLGRAVGVIAEGQFQPGVHRFNWIIPDNLTRGMYICRLAIQGSEKSYFSKILVR